MARIETSVVIARPQEDVFAYLTDLRNAMEWSTELVDVAYDGELSEGEHRIRYPQDGSQGDRNAVEDHVVRSSQPAGRRI
jgi:uncharacterized protein YndB with AHSA1/START domain